MFWAFFEDPCLQTAGRAVLQLFIEVDLFYILKITYKFKKRTCRSFIFNHCFIIENHVNTEK